MEPILIRVGLEYPIEYTDTQGNQKILEGSEYFEFTLLPLDFTYPTSRYIPTLKGDKMFVCQLDVLQIEHLHEHIRDAYIRKKKQGLWTAPKDYLDSIDLPKDYKFRCILYDFKNPQGSGKDRTSASWNYDISEYLVLELNYHYGLYKTIQNNQTMKDNRLNTPEINNLIAQMHLLSETIHNFSDCRESDKFVSTIGDLHLIANEYVAELKLATAKTDAVQGTLELGESKSTKPTVVDTKVPTVPQKETSTQQIKDSSVKKQSETSMKVDTTVQVATKEEKSVKSSVKENTQQPAQTASTEKKSVNTTSAATQEVEVNVSTVTSENKLSEKVEEVQATPEQVLRTIVDQAKAMISKEKTKTDFTKEERRSINELVKKIKDGTKLTFTLIEGAKEVTKEVFKTNNGLDRLVNWTRDMAKLEIKKALTAELEVSKEPVQGPTEASKEDIIAKAEEAAAEGKEEIDESEGNATEVEVTSTEVVKSEDDLLEEAIKAEAEAKKMGESKKVVNNGAAQKVAPVVPTSEVKATPVAATDSKVAPQEAEKEVKVISLDNGITPKQMYVEAESLDDINKMALNDITYTDEKGNIDGILFEDYLKNMIKANRAVDPAWISSEKKKVNEKEATVIVKDETFYSITMDVIPSALDVKNSKAPMFNNDINNYVAKLLATEAFVKAKTTLKRKVA